jgi:hypothetical protein
MVYRVENDRMLALVAEAKLAAEKAARQQATVSLQQWARKVVERYAHDATGWPFELNSAAVALLLKTGFEGDFDQLFAATEAALRHEWRNYHSFNDSFAIPWVVKRVTETGLSQYGNGETIRVVVKRASPIS